MARLDTISGSPDIVLIVDDDPAVRMMLERLVLAVSDFHPLAIATATEGYIRLAELHNRVALLLLDVTMHATDGFAFREMQLLGPTANVPTVVLSGRDLEPADLAHLRPAAALVKPVAFAALRLCIECYARRSADDEESVQAAMVRGRHGNRYPALVAG
jgi:DNA-binding response OmpR family regulator